MKHFDHAANEWDSEQKIKLMGTLAHKTQDSMELNSSIDILDFGCGTGLFGLEFLDHANTLTGVDTSSGMLKVFSEKTKNIKGVTALNLDLEEAENLEKKYDLILSSMAFHHLKDPAFILGKLANALKADGTIAIVDLEAEDGSFHSDPEKMGVKHFGFSNEQITEWAEKNHLKVKIKTIHFMEKEGKSYKQFLAIFKK